MNAGIDNAAKMCAMFNAEKYTWAKLYVNWNYPGEIMVETGPHNGQYKEIPTSTYRFKTDGTYNKLDHN